MFNFHGVRDQVESTMAAEEGEDEPKGWMEGCKDGRMEGWSSSVWGRTGGKNVEPISSFHHML